MTPISDSALLAAAAIVSAGIGALRWLSTTSRQRKIERKLDAIATAIATAASERAEVLDWVRAEEQRKRLADGRREQRALDRGEHERH